MAMTSMGLKTAIISEMIVQGFDPLNVATQGQAEAYIEAIATAVVTYIHANAEAVDTGTPATPAGNWPIA